MRTLRPHFALSLAPLLSLFASGCSGESDPAAGVEEDATGGAGRPDANVGFPDVPFPDSSGRDSTVADLGGRDVMMMGGDDSCETAIQTAVDQVRVDEQAIDPALEHDYFTFDV